MSRNNLARAGVLLACLGAAMALLASTAFAAGKPTVKGSFDWANTGLTNRTVKAEVNPNGASTTVTFEYGLYGGSLQTFATKTVESGTSPVQLSAAIRGLQPHTLYYVRVTATNSFGSAASNPGGAEAYWVVLGNQKAVASAVSEGTVRIDWKAGNNMQQEILCNASGSHSINHAVGIEDSHAFSTSGCKYYVDGVQLCTLPNALWIPSLNGTLTASSESSYYQLCTTTEELSKLSFSEPFVASVPFALAVTQPITLTASGKVNNNKATITIAGNWSLTGENIGRKFGVTVE